jgi:hypothetical protein
MSHVRKILRGVILAGALVLVSSVPSAAHAHGGCGFGFGCYPSFGCYPRVCYSPCYQPCYTPCYQTLYTPVVQTSLVQPVATGYVPLYGGCKVFIHKK